MRRVSNKKTRSQAIRLTNSGGRGRASIFSADGWDLRRGLLRGLLSLCHNDHGLKILNAIDFGGGWCTSSPWLDAMKMACSSFGILLCSWVLDFSRVWLCMVVPRLKKWSWRNCERYLSSSFSFWASCVFASVNLFGEEDAVKNDNVTRKFLKIYFLTYTL